MKESSKQLQQTELPPKKQKKKKFNKNYSKKEMLSPIQEIAPPIKLNF